MGDDTMLGGMDGEAAEGAALPAVTVAERDALLADKPGLHIDLSGVIVGFEAPAAPEAG